MNVKSIFLLVLAILSIIASAWAIQNPLGYFTLCEKCLGRLLCFTFVVVLTSIDVFYGLIACLAYMCMYTCYIITVKYKFQTDYIENYYRTFQNNNTNAGYDVPTAKPDNDLFMANQELIGKKIRYENLNTRNSLGRILHNGKIHKIKETQKVFANEERSEDPFRAPMFFL
jgi:hypothetical protein